MARGDVVVKSLLLCLLLSPILHTLHISGTSVGFSYDARETSPNSWSPTQTVSFLKRNKVQPSQFRVFLANPVAFIDSLSNTAIAVDLCVNQLQAEKLLKSRASATSWLKTHLLYTLPHIHITNIIASGSEQELPLLLPTLNAIRSALKIFHIDRSVKVSAIFPLSTLEVLQKTRKKNLYEIMKFIKDSESFIIVETHLAGELSLGSGFVRSVIQRARNACSVIPYDIPVVLNVKSSVIPSGVEVTQFTERVLKSIERHDQIKKRLHGIFVDVSTVNESEKEKLSWLGEVIFPSSHRELLIHDTKLMSPTKITVHDMMTPVTNPVTTPPITVPSTSPAPEIVTIPSTNPVTILPTNPASTPFTIPPANPVNPPITVPATNPMPTPATSPPVLPTNPVTTPTTFPVSPPVTNPVTTYPPSTPTVGTPSITPVTNPGTVPVSPTVSGQGWCVAKNGVTDAALQLGLDYACGIGGADCSTIQPSGSCYNPNTLQAHASYAFNSYYQRNPVATSCDFGGTAMLVSVNPSSATCIYPSSSSGSNFNPSSNSGLNPASTTGIGSGSGSGSSVLNTNNTGGPSGVFGTDNPTGSISMSFCLSAGWHILVFVLAAYWVAV